MRILNGVIANATKEEPGAFPIYFFFPKENFDPNKPTVLLFALNAGLSENLVHLLYDANLVIFDYLGYGSLVVWSPDADSARVVLDNAIRINNQNPSEGMYALLANKATPFVSNQVDLSFGDLV